MAFSIGRAPNYTQVAAGGSADTAIAGGSTCTIYGFILTNTNSSAETVLLEESDGSTEIMTISVPANSSFESSIQWLADSGLTVTPGANTDCVVFHGNAGS